MWDTNTLKKDTKKLRTYQDSIEQKLDLTYTMKEKQHKTKKTIPDAARETLGKTKINETKILKNKKKESLSREIQEVEDPNKEVTGISSQQLRRSGKNPKIVGCRDPFIECDNSHA